MKIINNDIFVNNLGLIPVIIPIRTIRKGNRKIAVIVGMHGEETSGLLVINKVIQKLSNKTNCEVNFILAANTLSQTMRTRVSPTDLFDLNRVFPGNMGGEISQRIAAKLLEFCLEMDLVIDLHTFDGQCPVVGIFMNSGNNSVKEDCLKSLSSMGVDCIWQLNFNSSDEVKMSGALGPILCDKGVHSIAIEMPGHEIITNTQVDLITSGIVNIINNVPIKAKNTPIISKINIRADFSGIFNSKIKVMSRVKKGQNIGNLIRMDDFKKISIMSPEDGLLVVNKNNHFVFTGEILASIGTKAH